jgi:hypothetical protein
LVHKEEEVVRAAHRAAMDHQMEPEEMEEIMEVVLVEEVAERPAAMVLEELEEKEQFVLFGLEVHANSQQLM